jgi:hypothetical protein
LTLTNHFSCMSLRHGASLPSVLTRGQKRQMHLYTIVLLIGALVLGRPSSPSHHSFTLHVFIFRLIVKHIANHISHSPNIVAHWPWLWFFIRQIRILFLSAYLPILPHLHHSSKLHSTDIHLSLKRKSEISNEYPPLLMMSALIPIISEIIPMMMPSSACIIKAKDIEPPYPTVEGPVIQRPAVVGKCDKMCASGIFSHEPPPCLGRS